MSGMEVQVRLVRESYSQSRFRPCSYVCRKELAQIGAGATYEGSAVLALGRCSTSGARSAATADPKLLLPPVPLNAFNDTDENMENPDFPSRPKRLLLLLNYAKPSDD